MMNRFTLPRLTSVNGPGYLLHAVQVLNRLGVPEANLRLLPAVDHHARREVLPYSDRLADSNVSREEVDPASLLISLGVNVRDDNRLSALMPLVAIGMPPREVTGRKRAEETADSAAGELSLAEWVLQWCGGEYDRFHEQSAEETALSPVERLAAQLRRQYPELAEHEPPVEASTGFIRASEFVSDYDAPPTGVVAQGRPDAEGSGEAPPSLLPTERGAPEELAELFFTRAFLAIASADMVGGFEFDHRRQPEGRDVPLVVDAKSRMDDVVEWYNAYPHLPVSDAPRTGEDEADRRLWQQYQEDYPETYTELLDSQRRWSATDPAMQRVYREIRALYEAGRTEPLSSDEMLSLAREHLPDYVPNYPQQVSVTGGLNLGGVLLTLINRWIDQEGGFLGLMRDDLDCFEPVEQGVLLSLLLYRGRLLDYGAIFRSAAALLVHEEIRVEIEQVVPYAAALGTPFAQPGRTMVAGGRSVLHSPEAVVRLPFDRAEGEEADRLEAKLGIIRRLFMPAHLPIRYVWGLGWVDLHPPTFPLNPAAESISSWDMEGYMRAEAEWAPAESTSEEA